MTREQIEKKAVERFPVDSFGKTELISKQYAKQNAYIEGALMVVESQWVSVDERLPNADGFYVCFYHGDAGVLFYTEPFRQFSNPSNGLYFTEKVTHWQPLPKPPKQTK